MIGSQIYIGTPAGVVLCVDGHDENSLKAKFYTSYTTEPVHVISWDQLIFEMERFYDDIRFPYPTTKSRSFTETAPKPYTNARKAKVMKDEELLSKHGDLGSFIIRVQHRQNSSWQGRVTWMEKNQTMNFRSVLELIKLIESAIDTVNDTEEEAAEPEWPEE